MATNPVNPVKLVYDEGGNPIALAEFAPTDFIPPQYLMLNVQLDGGAITDSYTLPVYVDGGLISDTYLPDAVFFDGGPIIK